MWLFFGYFISPKFFVNTHLYELVGIPFQNHGCSYGVGPLFGATTASTSLERLSTRFWNVSVRICVHSAKSAFVRPRVMAGWEGLACNPSSSSKLFGVEIRALCRTLESLHNKLTKPCLYGARFVHGIWKVFVCCSFNIYPSLEIMSLVQTLINSPIPLSRC